MIRKERTPSRKIRAKAPPRAIQTLKKSQIEKLATFLTDVMSKSTRSKLSTADLRLTTDRVKTILPTREELERMRRHGSPLTAILIVSPFYNDSKSRAPGESETTPSSQSPEEMMIEHAIESLPDWLLSGVQQRRCDECVKTWPRSYNYCPYCGVALT